MKPIRSFFYYTRIFWIISRLVLGLIFCYCATFLLEGADTADYFSAGFFAVVGLVFLWSFVAGLFLGGVNKWLRIFSGLALTGMALVIVYSSIDIFGFAEASILLILPTWFLLAGLFEFFGHTRKDSLQKAEPSDFPLEVDA